MSKYPEAADPQELDLSKVSSGVGNVFRRLNSFFYRVIRFILKNLVLFGILLVVGVALGLYLDHIQKRVYTNEIIVTPNFGSIDYLYSKIQLIDSKIAEGDTTFLNGIGIKNPKDLVGIKAKPIVDIFKFVSNNEQNYKLIELMAQDGDVKKISMDNTTSKNYPFHAITFMTLGKTSQEATVAPLLKYLNDNPYFQQVQRESINNVKLKMKENDSTIAQIDGILTEFAANISGGVKPNSQVYINENTQMNDVIRTKDALSNEQGSHRLELVGMDKIIKDSSIILNTKDKDSLNGKMKMVLPLLFIFAFLLVYFFRAFYKKQQLRHSAK